VSSHVSLVKYIQYQSKMRINLQREFDTLGVEFKDLMEQFNVPPYPIMDLTGESWTEYGPPMADLAPNAVYVCRRSGAYAWSFGVDSQRPNLFFPNKGDEHRVIAVSTEGKILLSECEGLYGSTEHKAEDGTRYILISGSADSSNDWARSRAKDQANFFIDFVELATTAGIKYVTKLFEDRMLEIYNNLRSSTY